MSRQSKVTLRDIAGQMNLSPMTVSRALRDSAEISEATKALVRATAKELGYIPNYWAKAARTGKFNNVAFLYTCLELKNGRPDTTFDHEFLSGIEEVIGAADLHLAISRLRKRPDQLTVDDLPRIFRERVTDGMIVQSEISATVKQALANQGIPVIYLNSNVKDETDCIYRDDTRVAYAATEKLIQLGHTRIVMPVVEDDSDYIHFSSHERRQGYTAAIEAHGLEPLFLSLPPHISGYEMAQQVLAQLQQKSAPTAIITAGAETIYLEALKAGISIPGELSIIALDMSFPSTRIFYKLDRIYMNRYEMGKTAAEMLLEKIKSPGQALPTVIPDFALEELGSTRAIRQHGGEDAS